AQHESEVAINTILRLTRMNYEQTHQTKSHLRHFIVMGVIHVRAVLPESELILKRLTRLDRRLRQAADAIHSVGQNDSVPMNTCCSRLLVGDVVSDSIYFDRFDCRTVYSAI